MARGDIGDLEASGWRAGRTEPVTIGSVGFHPANLSFRFLLEIVALVGLFRLGLELGDGGWRWVLGLAITIAGMTAWATWRVPGDRSAKDDAPYPTTGPRRLLIELSVFALGEVGWLLGGPEWVAWANLGALVLHHGLSYDRIGWLLKQT